MINYRSKFEKKVHTSIGLDVAYEPIKVNYTIPATVHSYCPDFVSGDVWIEAKGILDLETRKKMIYVRDQYPTKTIVFVFYNPNAKLYKGSKTTYAEWAVKNDFAVWSLAELQQKLNLTK